MFVCFMALAGVAVGLSGGVPIPFIKIRRDAEQENIELVEQVNEDADSEEFKI